MSRIKDLTGMKFGKLTVIELDKEWNHKGSAKWICQCDCGNVKSISSNSLNKGTKSCGCIGKNDLIGKRFGRLLVLEQKSIIEHYKSGTKHKKIFYLCKCDCGKIKQVSYKCLVNGETTSCGCLHKELLSKMSSTHKGSKTRLYRIWCGIKNRCLNKSSSEYKNYGGRGIKVCLEWDNSFELFRDWALSNGYSDELTIERIDVNGDYCPENCCWITKSEQANNTRRTVRIELFGQTKSLSQWVKMMGWNYGKFETRYRKRRTVFLENELKQIEEKLRSENL